MANNSTEDVVTLEISTGRSYQNVADIKEAIKQYRDELNDVNATQEQNAASAENLREAQAALKDAMYATTKSADDQLYSSKLLLAENGELNGSYNDLVHTLAELKSAWRSTTDEMERDALGKEIDRVNNKLKDLDANTGSFKRNVGNYAASVKQALGELPPALGPVDRGIKNVTRSVDLVSKNPLMGTLVLIVPILTRITKELKDNETAMSAIEKLMTAIQPIFDAAGKVIEKIAGWLSQAVDWFVKLASESGETFRKIVSGAVGVGNSLLQFLLAPIKTIIEAFKGLGNVIADVFTGQWKKIKDDAGTAIAGIKDAFTKGFDFKGNFELGKQAGEAFINGLGSTKKKAKSTAAGIKEAVAEELEELVQIATFTAEELERLLDKMDVNLQARINAEKAAAKEAADLEKIMVEQEKATLDEIDAMWEEHMQNQARLAEEEKQRRENLLTMYLSYANGVSSIVGSLADIIEAESEGSEKNAKQIKALRIAAATIDTISGAVSAYVSTWSSLLPLSVKSVLAPVNAAAVLTAGAANIAKIRNTQVSRNASGSTSATSLSAPTATTAPAIPQTIQETAAVQNAYNTQQLNQRTADQRVYILQSDLEASGRQVAVRESESTF